jgi:hypothetical protein
MRKEEKKNHVEELYKNGEKEGSRITVMFNFQKRETMQFFHLLEIFDNINSKFTLDVGSN